MTNREIAKKVQDLAKLMELHDENPFKIKGYNRAYMSIRNAADPLINLEKEELEKIAGIGKSISTKIIELKELGYFPQYNDLAEKTPKGILELLNLKGFGAKKIKAVWKELNVESAGELLYACEENRLLQLKGFGEKSQATLIDQLKYFIHSQGKYLYASIIDTASVLLEELRKTFPDEQFELVGELKLQRESADHIRILTTLAQPTLSAIPFLAHEDNAIHFQEIPVEVITADPEDYWQNLVLESSSQTFLESISIANNKHYKSEENVFVENGYLFVPSAMRENTYPQLQTRLLDYSPIQMKDIKGVIHSHSLYSDGANTIAQMAEQSKVLGYEYLVISDHSKAAFYANGLSVDRLYQQWKEIDELNTKMENFHIFKGIESDILNNGDLDYEEDILKQFDVVIASIHSNLRMNEEKAMDRLLKAIENPYTNILGHMTGRILLARKGYPIDHYKIIDACAANGVAIELNANPARLDMDWRYMDYALEKEVLIAINPDAHSLKGIEDIMYGLSIAQKAGIQPSECLNCKSTEELSNWLGKKI